MSQHLVESLVPSEPCTLIITCLSYKGVKTETFLEFLDHKNFVQHSPCQRSGDPSPHPTTMPALSYSQTSCLPSMFSFFLDRRDGIPCSVSCFEGLLLSYMQGRGFRAEGAFAADGREVRSPSLSL